jgi:hypothetical protein
MPAERAGQQGPADGLDELASFHQRPPPGL